MTPAIVFKEYNCQYGIMTWRYCVWVCSQITRCVNSFIYALILSSVKNISLCGTLSKVFHFLKQQVMMISLQLLWAHRDIVDHGYDTIHLAARCSHVCNIEIINYVILNSSY